MMLSFGSTPDMHVDSSRSGPNFRLILAGVGALLILGLVAQRHTNMSLGMPAEHHVELETTSPTTSCHTQLSRLVDKMPTGYAVDFDAIRAFPTTEDVKLGFIDGNGQARVVPFDATFKNAPMGRSLNLKRPHKYVVVGRDTAFLYPDNAVVVADNAECLVSGVYLGTTLGDYHPYVRTHVLPSSFSIDAASDSTGSGCVTWQMWFQFSKLGRTCVIYCYSEHCSGDGCRCNNNWITNEGWTKTREYKCGCNGHPACSKYGPPCEYMIDGIRLPRLGKCDLASNPCNFDNYFHTANNVQTTTQQVNRLVTAASQIPGPIQTPLRVVSVTLGLSHHTETPLDVYNRIMVELQNAFNQMGQCIDLKLMKVDITLIRTSIRKIQNNLSPDLLKIGLNTSAAAEARIRALHGDNNAHCSTIAATINVATVYDQLNVDTVMRVALQGMVLCVTAYNAAAVDYLNVINNGDPRRKEEFQDELKIRQASYKKRAGTVFEHMAGAINWIERHYQDVKRCGFFQPHKDLLCQKVSDLRTKILVPLGKIALGMYDGSCVNYHTNQLLIGGDVGRSSQTSVENCQTDCRNDPNCACYTWDQVSKVCTRRRGEVCDSFNVINTTRMYDNGICTGAKLVGGTLPMVDLGADEATCADASHCVESEKCVGYRLDAQKKCVEIESEEDAKTFAPHVVMFGDAMVFRTEKKRVEKQKVGERVDVPHWGSCLALCSARTLCSAVDVRRLKSKAECFLFSREDVWKDLRELVDDRRFDHYDMLRGMSVDSVQRPQVKANIGTFGCNKCIPMYRMNILGEDTINEPRPDYKACEAMCLGVATCRGFGFDANQKRCYLKRGAANGFARREVTLNSAVCPANGQRCNYIDKWDGVSVVGNDIVGKLPTFSIEQCETLCLLLDGCTFYTWNRKLNKCWLKSSDSHGRTSNNPDDMSGRCR